MTPPSVVFPREGLSAAPAFARRSRSRPDSVAAFAIANKDFSTVVDVSSRKSLVHIMFVESPGVPQHDAACVEWHYHRELADNAHTTLRLY